MRKDIYVYRLTDAKGDKHITVVDDPSDSGCIGGIGSDGEYHQYDSYELYHAYGWAEGFGMKLESSKVVLEIPDSIFDEHRDSSGLNLVADGKHDLPYFTCAKVGSGDLFEACKS